MGVDAEAGEVVVGVAAVAVVVAGVSVLRRYFTDISLIAIHNAVENLPMDEVCEPKYFFLFFLFTASATLCTSIF